MPDKWLQVKGDPSVRNFLFEQRRIESLFDTQLNRIHDIVYTPLTYKGAFSRQGALLIQSADLLVRR